jgi:hypothetical protein
MFPYALEEEIRKTLKPKDAIIPFGKLLCIAKGASAACIH